MGDDELIKVQIWRKVSVMVSVENEYYLNECII